MTLKGVLLLKGDQGNYKEESVSIKLVWWSINLLNWW